MQTAVSIVNQPLIILSTIIASNLVKVAKNCQIATLFRYNINAAKWTKIGFQPRLQLEALIHRLVATQAVVEIDVPDQPVVSKVVIIQAVIDVHRCT